MCKRACFVLSLLFVFLSFFVFAQETETKKDLVTIEPEVLKLPSIPSGSVFVLFLKVTLQSDPSRQCYMGAFGIGDSVFYFYGPYPKDKYLFFVRGQKVKEHLETLCADQKYRDACVKQTMEKKKAELEKALEGRPDLSGLSADDRKMLAASIMARSKSESNEAEAFLDRLHQAAILDKDEDGYESVLVGHTEVDKSGLPDATTIRAFMLNISPLTELVVQEWLQEKQLSEPVQKLLSTILPNRD